MQVSSTVSAPLTTTLPSRQLACRRRRRRRQGRHHQRQRPRQPGIMRRAGVSHRQGRELHVSSPSSGTATVPPRSPPTGSASACMAPRRFWGALRSYSGWDVLLVRLLRVSVGGVVPVALLLAGTPCTPCRIPCTPCRTPFPAPALTLFLPAPLPLPFPQALRRPQRLRHLRPSRPVRHQLQRPAADQPRPQQPQRRPVHLRAALLRLDIYQGN